jgi:hypothetical protein
MRMMNWLPVRDVRPAHWHTFQAGQVFDQVMEAHGAVVE